mgnify:CR=1 FL=1
MNRNNLILGTQIIVAIAASIFFINLSIVSFGSWTWLGYPVLFLVVVGCLGSFVNKGANAGTNALRRSIRPESETEDESSLDIVEALMAGGLSKRDALDLVREYSEAEFQRRR